MQLTLSVPVFEEYCDVLLRPASLKQFGISKDDVQAVLDFIAFVGLKTDIRFLLRPNLKDENDNIFIELAFASDAKYIITRNIRDFTKNNDLKFEEIEIITPTDFIHYWREHYE